MRTVVDVVELLRTTRNNLRKYYSHQFRFLALIVVPIRSPWAVLGSIDVMALTELMLSCNCDIRWLTNLSRRNPMCAASLNMMIIDEIFWWSKWYAIFVFCHTIFVTNISVFTQFCAYFCNFSILLSSLFSQKFIQHLQLFICVFIAVFSNYCSFVCVCSNCTFLAFKCAFKTDTYSFVQI